MPTLQPASTWQKSGRWESMGEIMFRLEDRHGAEAALGVTAEEIFFAIVGSEITSYKQLPQMWYQIHTKYRDEARPKSGLLRVREFTMKDAYSFDLDEQGLDASFNLQHEAYSRIFTNGSRRLFLLRPHQGIWGDLTVLSLWSGQILAKIKQ